MFLSEKNFYADPFPLTSLAWGLRKIWGLRHVLGYIGLLQPFTDILHLLQAVRGLQKAVKGV